jgi:hypothetical protein
MTSSTKARWSSVVSLLVCACASSTPPEPEPAPVQAEPQPNPVVVEVEPAPSEPAPERTDAAAASPLGIPVCEAYLALYESCEEYLKPEIMAGNRRFAHAERAR